jgi:hypothetical protein
LITYVFGYASLVALREPLEIDGVEHVPVPGRLRGFRRCWGVAMNNWEGGDAVKHFLDRDTGKRPHIRVAYLDLREEVGSVVNGLALPVDADRLEALDAREVNYARIEVSGAFEPAIPQQVYTYVGLDAARERCRQGAVEGNAFVSRCYVAEVRRAFERLGSNSLVDFDRTTDPLSLPERDLEMILPSQGPPDTGS